MKNCRLKRDSGSIRSKRNCCDANNSVTRFARSGSSQGETKRPVVLYLPNEPEVAEIYIMLSSHAKSVSRAEFTLVLRTELGEAALLANGVDEMSDERILGTVAGANTLLIVCRDQEAAIEIQNEILGMMQ